MKKWSNLRVLDLRTALPARILAGWLVQKLPGVSGMKAKSCVRLGLTYAAANDHARAAGCFRKALAHDPEHHPNALHHLGLSLRAQGQLQKAEEALRRSTALKPHAYWSYQALGETLMEQGREREAEAVLRQGAGMAPSKAWVHYHLGECLILQGKKGEALDLWITAASRHPEASWLDLTMKWTEFWDASLATAKRLDMLRQITALFDQAMAPVYWLCKLLDQTGNPRDAVPSYQRLSRLRLKRDYPHLPVASGPDTAIEPDFVVIGLRKAGTTSLYTYLTRHPRIVPSLEKELNFWPENEKAGVCRYRSQFLPVARGAGIVTGEASPAYFADREAAKGMRTLFPDMKIVLILRDPVARAYSDFQQESRLGKEFRPWEEVVDQELAEVPRCPLEPERLPKAQACFYLRHSMILPYLKIWRQSFPRDQMCIVFSQDLFRHTKDIVNQVFAFLDLPACDLRSYQNVNPGKYGPMETKTEHRLRTYFREHDLALEAYLNRPLPWRVQP